MYEILVTQEFTKWYSKQQVKIKTLVDSRIRRVKHSGELGDVKYLGEKLFEFRWKVGIRLYFTIKEDKIIFLLIGGTKNDQKKDIKKARSLQKNYQV